MSKESASTAVSTEPQAMPASLAQQDRTGTSAPSGEMDLANGPEMDARVETDDVCRCGALRSQKNLERCRRGHPMPGVVLNPRKRGSRSQTRVEQLEAQFTDDYKPRTHRQRMEVKRLADLWEQRERIECSEREVGGIEHQRLDGIIQALVDRLESSRSEPTNGTGAPIVILPENHREWDQRVERGDDLLKELRGEAQPGVAEPSREESVGMATPAAVTPGERLIDTYLVPERQVTSTESRVTLRPIRESEVEACMDLQGDLPRYRSGEIPRVVAYRQTQNWLKSKGGFL